MVTAASADFWGVHAPPTADPHVITATWLSSSEPCVPIQRATWEVTMGRRQMASRAGSPPPPLVHYGPQGFGSTFLAAGFTLSSGSPPYLLPLPPLRQHRPEAPQSVPIR